MSAQDWRPSADIETLKARSRLMTALRVFFESRGCLEVDTPTLNSSGTVDPNIESIWAASGTQLLHTSPEFAMKRLLAAGSGPVYQICKVFRQDESGRLHNPEFTLLEWYQTGFDHHQLMDEMDTLLQALGVIGEDDSSEKFTYAELFRQRLGIDVFAASTAELEQVAINEGIQIEAGEMSRDEWLDLLMGECIGPGLGQKTPEFIYDFPASQASLARISEDNPQVAERFELIWKGVELANGFHELTDAAEQRSRFERELDIRKAHGKPEPLIDERLLAALEHGLPDCAGVALGVDRLLMLMLGKSRLSEVLSFSSERV